MPDLGPRLHEALGSGRIGCLLLAPQFFRENHMDQCDLHGRFRVSDEMASRLLAPLTFYMTKNYVNPAFPFRLLGTPAAEYTMSASYFYDRKHRFWDRHLEIFKMSRSWAGPSASKGDKSKPFGPTTRPTGLQSRGNATLVPGPAATARYCCLAAICEKLMRRWLGAPFDIDARRVPP